MQGLTPEAQMDYLKRLKLLTTQKKRTLPVKWFDLDTYTKENLVRETWEAIIPKGKE